MAKNLKSGKLDTKNKNLWGVYFRLNSVKRKFWLFLLSIHQHSIKKLKVSKISSNKEIPHFIVPKYYLEIPKFQTF